MEGSGINWNLLAVRPHGIGEMSEVGKMQTEAAREEVLEAFEGFNFRRILSPFECKILQLYVVGGKSLVEIKKELNIETFAKARKAFNKIHKKLLKHYQKNAILSSGKEKAGETKED